MRTSSLDAFLNSNKQQNANSYEDVSESDSNSNSIIYTEEDCEADIQILMKRGYSRELAEIMHKQQVNELRELSKCGSEASNKMVRLDISSNQLNYE